MLFPPLGYLEFLNLMAHASVVLTDSGGIQEETTVLNIPCITLRDSTERPITLTEGTNILVHDDPEKMIAAVDKALNGKSYRGACPALWDGHAAERIISILDSKTREFFTFIMTFQSFKCKSSEFIHKILSVMPVPHLMPISLSFTILCRRRQGADTNFCELCGVNSNGEASDWKTTRFLKQPVAAFLTHLISISLVCAVTTVRCRMIHRVDGPLAVYRGIDDGTDRKIFELNQEIADATIFQSQFSLKKHLELGFDFAKPIVIPNAADPVIFHSRDRLPFSEKRKIRLISVSWSDNVNKGAPVYKWLDEHLDWDQFEYTFVGSSPVSF